MVKKNSLKMISDDELLRRLLELLRSSRRVESDLVAHIGEVDERRLYARQAAPSMFSYCTEVLHLSEAEAYLRITVARASRQHPMLLTMLAEGRLHLRGLARIAPHLTPGNRDEVLQRAAHRSKREIEELLAELAPRPDAPTRIRKLPRRQVTTPQPNSDRAAEPTRPRPAAAQVTGELCPGRVPAVPTPRPHARVEPLAPSRWQVQFTASAQFHEKLERLQALMRSSVPDGDLAAIIEQAVTEKLERLEARRFAKVKAPRKTLAETDTSASSRYIPAAVRRAVHERDGGRCSFEDSRGKRCSARDRLEFHHHDRPYGRGGDHRPDGIRLMCRVHNGFLAEREYGKDLMDGSRRSREGGFPAAGEGVPPP